MYVFRKLEEHFVEKKRIDNALREAIENSGRSLNALSKVCHVHVSALARFKKGERDLRLSSAAKVVEALGFDFTLTRFLWSAATISAELEDMVKTTGNKIKVIGTRSRLTSYLSSIETAVEDRSVFYYRLLAGPSITHELHEHLSRLLDSPKVMIRRTPAAYFSHLTITDDECLLLLPAAQRDYLHGMRFSGYAHSLRFSDYFWEVFDTFSREEDQVGNEKTLSDLCETCSTKFDDTGRPNSNERLV